MKKVFLILLLGLSLNLFAVDGIILQTLEPSLIEKWYHTSFEAIPIFSSVGKVYKKQYFHLGVVLSEYALDAHKGANISFTLKILRPDGTIYAEYHDIPALKRIIKIPNATHLSEAYLKICFENEDPFGKYKIEIELYDHVANKKKKLSSTISLIKLPSYTKLVKVKNMEQFSDWMETYYQNPSPEKAIGYYMFFADGNYDDKNSFASFMFFKEILKNNPFLKEHIIEAYGKTKNEELMLKLLLLLSTTTENDNEDFFNSLSDSEKTAYQEIKKIEFPDPYGKIDHVQLLDVLWATFRANGSYAPILKLIQTLDYERYLGSIEKLEKIEESKITEKDRENAYFETIYMALLWSLNAHFKQHPLVLEYCLWAYHFEELSDVQRDKLGSLLKASLEEKR